MRTKQQPALLSERRMITRDITKTNRAVRDLLDRTENPRHRFLLMVTTGTNLEMAGRYEEILAPDMMVEDPVYHLRASCLIRRHSLLSFCST